MKFDPSLPDDGHNVSRTHPLREALLLVVGVVAAGAVLMLTIAVAIDLIVPRLPLSLETRLFSASWLDFNKDRSEDPRTLAVATLIERLARHWPECPYEFQLSILEAEQPNAFAFPGGWVVVTTGLLEQAESENELAFVLGHELGHFRNRDHLRGLGRSIAFSVILSVLNVGRVTELAGLAGGLAQRSFDRDQERDADQFGLALVAAEYGHVANAWDFFERLPDPSRFAARQLAHYLSTHPLSEQRIDDLRGFAHSEGWSTHGEVTPFRIGE